jgi:hypothetical protein
LQAFGQGGLLMLKLLTPLFDKCWQGNGRIDRYVTSLTITMAFNGQTASTE